ncbi:hypothetical protein TYRP_005025 [Tyrophagus putrescentiae]|nr:hypothetical protein TYRP_005025 [Tyrophagus putrescentiae]
MSKGASGVTNSTDWNSKLAVVTLLTLTPMHPGDGDNDDALFAAIFSALAVQQLCQESTTVSSTTFAAFFIASTRSVGAGWSSRRYTQSASVGEIIGSIFDVLEPLSSTTTSSSVLAISTVRTTRSSAAGVIRSRDNRSRRGTSLVTAARVVAVVAAIKLVSSRHSSDEVLQL